jgi:hypothetical protein
MTEHCYSGLANCKPIIEGVLKYSRLMIPMIKGGGEKERRTGTTAA